MGMTMTQKILAAHAGLPVVHAGDLIEADLDLVLGNDVTTPVAINELSKFKKKTVFDNTKIALVMDHFTPNKDIKSAEHVKQVRDFSRENNIVNYFDVGQMGIEHALLPEKGLIVAGNTCIGADSHTCTYGALGAFSTGVGSTDMAAGMVTGKAWFKVPAAIKFVITGKKPEWISGKDLILHIIGKIGVDGARYKSMEFVGDGIAELKRARDNFEKAVATNDNRIIAQADVEFHNVIIKATGNDRLISLEDSLSLPMYRYRYEYIKDSSGHNNLVKEHRKIVNAIEKRNPEAAASEAGEHIDNQRRSIMRQIRLEREEETMNALYGKRTIR